VGCVVKVVSWNFKWKEGAETGEKKAGGTTASGHGLERRRQRERERERERATQTAAKAKP
jgi:hypothetical protein